MTNIEHYKDEILNHKREGFCSGFVKPIILKQYNKICEDVTCMQCGVIQTLWAQEEYKEPEEPEVDWSKVVVDTPILVSYEGKEWFKKHFAKYEDGKVYAWGNGKTSFTADTSSAYTDWLYAKLAEVEE